MDSIILISGLSWSLLFYMREHKKKLVEVRTYDQHQMTVCWDLEDTVSEMTFILGNHLNCSER